MENCEKCGKEISEKIVEYSISNYNQKLCMPCQSIETQKKTKIQSPITESVYNENIKQTQTKEEDKEFDGIPTRFIKIINGKKYITHEGLVFVAHAKGLKSIKSELITKPIQTEEELKQSFIIFKSIITTIDPETKQEIIYEAYGDACAINVGSQIKPHILRMAETRAINRALRLATGMGTSAEEFD